VFRLCEADHRFLHVALSYALYYCRPAAGDRAGPCYLDISCYTESPFYHSCDGQHLSESRGHDGRPRFFQSDKPMHALCKTGLGTSAAFVTSLIGAVLAFCGRPFSRSSIHLLSQLAHWTAQGRLGSGFDVACCVYGSIVFSRASEAATRTLLQDSLRHSDDPEAFRRSVDAAGWPGSIEHVREARLSLLMASLSGQPGSQTPFLVSRLHGWLASLSEAARERVWQPWRKAHGAVVSAYFRLCGLQGSLAVEAYASLAEATMAACRCHKDAWPVYSWVTPLSMQQQALLDAWASLWRASKDYRQALAQVTHDSGLPLQPRELRALLEQTASIPGVLLASLPGGRRPS